MKRGQIQSSIDVKGDIMNPHGANKKDINSIVLSADIRKEPMRGS